MNIHLYIQQNWILEVDKQVIYHQKLMNLDKSTSSLLQSVSSVVHFYFVLLFNNLLRILNCTLYSIHIDRVF